jgi:hypothetical protein
VNVHRRGEPGVAVAKLVGDHPVRDARLDQQRGVGVAQAVRGDDRDAGPPAQPLEPGRDGVGQGRQPRLPAVVLGCEGEVIG